MKIRPKIEDALSVTAERLTPGSGSKAVHHAKNDLSLIDATSEDLNGRYADQDVVIASPGLFETKHLDGDQVTFSKHHDGVIVVFPGSFLFIRRMGLGAREIKAVNAGDVTVEPVTTVVDGAEIPGLKVTGHAGGPHFAMAIAQEKQQSDPAQQTAVRDEIHAALTS
jgi:hypothetical protein